MTNTSDSVAGIGGWCQVPSTVILETMLEAGSRWICIDLQHGLHGARMPVDLIQICNAYGAPCFVRVAENSYSSIGLALDAGADGVIVPLINTLIEAEQAVSAALLPPEGSRSWGPIRTGPSNVPWEKPLVILQIETPAALDELDAIANIDGVAGLLAGPSDLGLRMGLGHAALTSPQLVEAIERIGNTCKSKNLVAGIALPLEARDMISQYRTWGYRMISIGSDLAIFGEAWERHVNSLASNRPSPAAGPTPH